MSEIEEIKLQYEAGRLDGIKGDLERFLVAHRERILDFQRGEIERGFTNMPLDVAVKFYILKNRTVNPQRDIAEQLEEIDREKWIRGVKGGNEPDAQRVAVEWAHKYSAAWRAHRVTVIVFVFEYDKERFLKLLES